MERGKAILPKDKIGICMELAFKIVHISGAIFPHECEFYDLIKKFDPKKATIFNKSEYALLESLLDDFDKKSSMFCWRLQSSRFRVGPPKIGRNISIRYISALKTEKNSSADSVRRKSVRLRKPSKDDLPFKKNVLMHDSSTINDLI